MITLQPRPKRLIKIGEKPAVNKVHSSVFSQHIERGKRVANQIDTGMVFINTLHVYRQTCLLEAPGVQDMEGNFLN